MSVSFARHGLLLSTLMGWALPVSAQPSQQATVQAVRGEIDQLRKEFEQLQQRYGDRLSALEARLAQLQPGVAPPAAPPSPTEAPQPTQPPGQAPPGTAPQPPTIEVPAGAAGAGGPSGTLPVYGNVAALSKIFNPDIAVIGDFLGAGGRNAVNPARALEMHESEASFQAIVDPYARADFFLSFGEEGVELEEGYVSFPTIPGGLLLKVGRMRGAFGKVNTLHNHMLPWTDRPLVINNLVGGEEGIADAGISVARLIPNPWVFLEATGQVYRGDSAVFRASTRTDLTYVGHLRGYQDITESSNIDLGASYAHGHNDAIRFDGIDQSGPVTRIYGIDATFRYRPLRRAIYRSVVGRSELIWSRRNLLDGRQDAFGYYVSADYQFARRWFVGTRHDRSARADDAMVRDRGQSLLLTYWPSEFSQIRGQYRRIRYADEQTANEFLFQFQFSIGAHGAHPF